MAVKYEINSVSMNEAEYNSFVEKMREIWCSNLGVDSIADDDNYFVLGGNSLRGIKLLSEINAVSGVEIDYNDIFEFQEFLPLTEKIYEAVIAGKR